MAVRTRNCPRSSHKTFTGMKWAHSRLRNYFSNAAYRQKSTRYKIRIRDRPKYSIDVPACRADKKYCQHIQKKTNRV